jgi:fructose-1,6-bisphosphatase/inositol monophosphatase family enzyme
VVLNSATGELFEAVRGGGSRLDGEPIRVSEVAELRLALVGTGFPFKRLELLPAYLEIFERVLRATSGIRRGGAAALDLCHLACGRLDAFWEFWLETWDVAGGALILREAGGSFEPLRMRGLELGPDPSSGMGADAAEIGGSGAELTALQGARGVESAEIPDDLRPGAFLGANGCLLEVFRGLVRAE